MVLVSDKPMNFIVLTGLIVMVMPCLHTGRKRHTLLGTEEPMIPLAFLTALFYEVEEQLRTIPTPPRSPLRAPGGGHLGAVACAARRRAPALLSLVDARLSAVGAPPARADAAL